MSGTGEYSPDQFSKEAMVAYASKKESKHYDPCQEAANRSIKCIHRNPGNKDFCNEYFQAYRDCKKAWTEAQREMKRNSPGGGWFS